MSNITLPDHVQDRKTLEQWLAEVDYDFLNNGKYKPTDFALSFANLIKLINGSQGEENTTPPVHLKMLDKLTSKKKYVANLCFRGAAKTTLFFEYLIPYIAIFGKLPNQPEITGIIFVADTMENGAKKARNNLEHRWKNSEFLQEWLPYAHFTDPYIELGNKDGGRVGIYLYGAETGIRGTKIFGKRPTLAILDDLVSDKASKSPTTMKAIKDAVDKGIDFALHPTNKRVIFNGTPFNKTDILIEAVESGTWDVNVWPVCERFPCTEEEFRGAWEDRFPYSYVRETYDRAKAAGKLQAFYQELMLQISAEEDRLIQDSEIQWYSRKDLLDMREYFNWYITTDAAVSTKQSADDAVLSVWAYGANNDWFWVDGVCDKMGMDVFVDNLFRFNRQYSPLSVGIETNGQQRGFIPWLKSEMVRRNEWFNFASNSKTNEPGITVVNDKFARFQIVTPLFKAGKIHFPEEMRESLIMNKFTTQLRLITADGIKGKDDAIDTISQLQYMKPIAPSQGIPSNIQGAAGISFMHQQVAPSGNLSSYVV